MLDPVTVNRAAQIAALNLIRRRLLLAQGSIDMMLRGLLNGALPSGADPMEQTGNGSDNEEAAHV